MKKPLYRHLSIAIPLFAILLFIFGCSGVPLKHQSPSIMKEFKHYERVVVHASHFPWTKTDIVVQKGDMMIFLVSGSGSLFPYRAMSRNAPPSRYLFYRIGNSQQGYAYKNSYTSILDIEASGRLEFAVIEGSLQHPEFANYKGNTGYFNIDVFIFEKSKIDDIPNLLRELARQNPEDHTFYARVEEISNKYVMFYAEKKTKEEISETEDEIQKLAKKTESEDKAEALTAKDDLEIMKAKLAQLTGQLEQLANLKKAYAEQQLREKELLAELAEEKKKQKGISPTTYEEEYRLREQKLLARLKEEQKLREEELLAQVKKAKQRPPIVFIGSPKTGIGVETRNITISGIVEDEDSIKTVECILNGRIIADIYGRGIVISPKRKQKRYEFHKRIRLDKGENILQIKAIDSDGLEAMREVIVNYIEIRKNIWSVVIGIDTYENVRHLRYASSDAQAFYDYLIQNFNVPRDNVTLLLNREARLDNIKSALGTHLKRKAGKDDMVFIYFAGHGATEADTASPDGDGLEKYILPCDADLKDLFATALPMSDIARIFNRIQSERIIFIADACYSGASGGRTIGIPGMRATVSENFMNRISTGKGRVIITASGANEISVEDDDLKHGVFTYYLLEGLKGKADFDRDGIITVDEAYTYVSNNVSIATGQAQHPVKKGSVEGQLIMGIVK